MNRSTVFGFVVAALINSVSSAADWIWTNDNPSEQQTAYFRRTFELAQPGPAELVVTADNSYELFVNGKSLGQDTDSNWATAERFNIQPLLKPGRNVIAVRATNAGGPAGCMVHATIQDGQKSIEVSSSGSWKSSGLRIASWNRPDLDDSAWPAAHVFGEVGKTAPWGEVAFAQQATAQAAPQKRPAARQPFEFKDADRVVLLGGTFIERAQRYGWVETELQLASPGKKISFRNLGWSGDTVWAESRGIFDAPSVGYARMIEQVREMRPTVILMNYGSNEAFKGPAGIDSFLEQYERLINDLSVTNAQIVLLSPIPQFKMSAPLPDPARINGLTKQYVDAIRDFASEQQLGFVDLWTEHLKATGAGHGLSDDGIHLNRDGYRLAATILAKQLLGQESGRKADNESLNVIVEKTIDKNRMYFHRWRPQNVTYLFGFRKHEQGNNAKEVAEFEPIVQEMDAQIFDLKQTYLASQSRATKK